jgi:AcrR family transcriptional regulator
LGIKDKPVDDKAEIIINAAQKRFGLYGAEKTTMKEIADDLHMSKASLYYYFPDKENLYAAVIRKEQIEFLKKLEKDITTVDDPAMCLRKYALTRLSYFKILMNLSRLRLTSLSGLKPKIVSSMADFREEEKSLIMNVLEKGKKSGQFTFHDTSRIAILFLDLLRGLRSAFIADKDFLVIDETEYKMLSEKVTGITEIFIKGLMYK